MLHAVTLTDGDGSIVLGVEVDGDAVWGADLILAAITLTDGAGLVIDAAEMFVELSKDFASLVGEFLRKRKDSDLIWGKSR